MENRIINKILKKKFFIILTALGIIVIAVSSFFEAIKNITHPFINGNNKGIITNVSLASYLDKDVLTHIDTYLSLDDFDSIDANPYSSYIFKDTLVIYNNSSYINSYYNDKYINAEYQGQCMFWSALVVDYPVLDIKILNKSNETLVIDGLELNVQNSQTEQRPLLYIYTSQENEIAFANEGWSYWAYFDFYFNLYRSKKEYNLQEKNNINFSNIIRVNYFKNYKNIDLRDYILKLISNKGLYKYRETTNNRDTIKMIYSGFDNSDDYYKEVSPEEYSEYEGDTTTEENSYDDDNENYIEYFAFLFGKIKISYAGKIDSTFIEAWIPVINYGECGDGLDIYDNYEIRFKSKGSNYKINYPISLKIKSQDAERILLTLRADKTSYHNFNIKFNNLNGLNIYSKPIKSQIFIPKSFQKDHIKN